MTNHLLTSWDIYTNILMFPEQNLTTLFGGPGLKNTTDHADDEDRSYDDDDHDDHAW